MDVVDQEGIKIPNTVIVSGATGTADDEELMKILQKHYIILLLGQSKFKILNLSFIMT